MSQYLDTLVIINNEYLEQAVDTIYPKELQFNKTTSSESGAPLPDLILSISNDII